MADKAHIETEEKLAEMERHLSAIYTKAQASVGKEWKSYLSHMDEGLISLQKEYESLKAEGKTKEASAKASEIQKQKMNKTLGDKRYRELSHQLAEELAHVNQTALAYMNDQLPDIYSLNYNSFEDQVGSKIGGYSFTLTDANTVKLLATTDRDLLPYKYLDLRKDLGWNMKLINSEVLQGILIGEPMNKIADRLQNVGVKNRNSAIRNARTMVTGAECKGRQDSYVKAENDGLILKRVWIAAHDSRTRHAHALLDGAETEVDKPFNSELGEIMYPGDPQAEPANTYNCRCSIKAKFMGFKKKTDHPVAQGEDITSTWVRRKDQFDFDVEDIVNAQGFDGLPQVVDAKAFDEAVKKSSFVAQRGYMAESKEVLDTYRDQLYNGKWYLECKGGAAFGNGMYAGYDSSGVVTGLVHDTAKRYSGYGKGYIETFTFTPDARTISYDDIYEKLNEHKKTWGYRGKARDEFVYQKVSDATSSMGFTSNETKYALESYFNYKTDDSADVYRWYQSLTPKEVSALDEKCSALEELYNEIDATERANRYMDVGSLAALMGYDAILVENESYVVVLNRTKTIFRRGG